MLTKAGNPFSHKMPSTWFILAVYVFPGLGVVNAIRASLGRAGATHNLAKHYSCSDHLMVYGLPKTGTTTLSWSTGQLCNKYEVLYVGEKLNEYPTAIDVHLAHDAAKDFVRRIPPNQTLWILSAVRFPVARLMSDWFQNNYCLINTTAAGAKLYNDWVWGRANKGTQSYFSEWAEVTGMDLLSQSFDHEKKHNFIEYSMDGRSIKVILLRMEDVANWETIVSQYLPGWKMVDGNQGDDKVYAEDYENFKQNFFYKKSQLQTILANSPELHFYTKTEIEEYVAGVNTVPDDVDNVALMEPKDQFFRTLERPCPA